MRTNDVQLERLMEQAATGVIQLPDFQRGWVWGDDRIRALLLSVLRSFPVGAAMFLEYGNPDVRFRYRPIEGADPTAVHTLPKDLILDGQQRLTSLHAALMSQTPVTTTSKSGKEIKVYYYIDIAKALDPYADEEDVIVSVPESRVETGVFGRDVIRDYSTREKEYGAKVFPVNMIVDGAATFQWQTEFADFYKDRPDRDEAMKMYTRFIQDVLTPMRQYTMPVITLDRNTTKEAVCRVFENVNTGGLDLTVFELVTASFAAEDFQLREDWDARHKAHFCDGILSAVRKADFLTTVTLYASQFGRVVGCKKRDVLNLSLRDYKKHADVVTNGYREAAKLLQEERIFSQRDLPYNTQLTPLAAICAALVEEKQINAAPVREKLKQWYWCGVMGELYGSATETRFALDLVQVLDWTLRNGPEPKTCQDSYFQPERLLTLQTRNAAAYKGVLALLLQDGCQDFRSGRDMDISFFNDENIDLHHIFPQAYCKAQKYPREKWNSIVNKTPISASTNRFLGGAAPSAYIAKIQNKDKLDPEKLDAYLRSHLIQPQFLRDDDFDDFFTARAKGILDAIERATHRKIQGRDAPQVVKSFGTPLT